MKAERADAGWNVLLGLSLVAIVAVGWYGFFRPKPPIVDKRNELGALSASALKARIDADVVLQDVKARTWEVSEEVLGSTTIQMLTSLAEQDHLQVTGFQTGKAAEISHMSAAPFTVGVQGAFMDVMALVKTLEDPHSKLMVNELQILSTDGDTDRITATISLIGFIDKVGK